MYVLEAADQHGGSVQEAGVGGAPERVEGMLTRLLDIVG